MGKTKNNFTFKNIATALKANKAFKVICVIFVLFILAIIALNIYKNIITNINTNYQITSQKVNIKIDETNKAYFNETYVVELNSNASSFEVDIPLSSDHNFLTKIKNINVKDYAKKIIKEDDLVKIIIDTNCNENELNSSNYTRTFEISYIVDRGDDSDNEIDYIDYYISSPYKTCKVNNLSFIIELPKNTKSTIENNYKLFNKISLSGSETTLTKNDSKITLSEDGTKLTGTLKSSLNAYEGLKLSHETYNNYFENERNAKKDDNKLILLYIIFFFICFINFFLCGRDCTMLYTVSEEIPKNISPLLTALLLANSEDDENKINDFECKHLSSLLIKWANDGLIHIERFKVPLTLNNQIENAEKELFALERINTLSHAESDERKKERFNSFKKIQEETVKDYTIEYRITKLKDPMLSDIPYFEKYIFDGIFVMQVNGVVDTQIIKANYGAFRECILYLKNQIANAKRELLTYMSKVKAQQKDSKADKKRKELKSISYICWLITVSFETLIYYNSYNDLIPPVIFLLLLALLDFVILCDNNKINILSSLIILFIGYYILNINIYAYLILSLTNLLIVIIRKYTFQYELIVEKVKSLKKFIKRKKRVGIVNALNENPKYFYMALPHAISLNESKELVEMCEEFKIAMPGWLLMHPNDFSISLFKDMINEIDETWNYIIDNTI